MPMGIKLSTKLQRLDTKAHGLLNFLALFDRIKQMAFGPIVGMMFGDFFKELYTIHVPTYDVITHVCS
jgi:ABC-type enterochelin transport system permease subunit